MPDSETELGVDYRKKNPNLIVFISRLIWINNFFFRFLLKRLHFKYFFFITFNYIFKYRNFGVKVYFSVTISAINVIRLVRSNVKRFCGVNNSVLVLITSIVQEVKWRPDAEVDYDVNYAGENISNTLSVHNTV